jgi:hypothetical protein
MDTDQPPCLLNYEWHCLALSCTLFINLLALLSRVGVPPLDGGGDEFERYALTTNDIPVALFALYVPYAILK